MNNEWLIDFYNKNRLAIWMLGITDLDLLEKILRQEEQSKEKQDVEKIILSESSWTFQYVSRLINKPFPPGEHYFIRYPEWAYWYACVILKGRFPKGEEIISSHRYLKVIYELRFRVKL